ncbi:serine/threonine-protein kinase RIO1-like [Centruroides sculpturatus]|uniref:serine/threonine-protein kinase RIO1-like n=1 Tax=Centruroides sculpturatus TaxID=218467 RepID=UPI000C6E1626|nr:serine/threonine-protein kinase RIO1-like [Centruroides sculpturatus]
MVKKLHFDVDKEEEIEPYEDDNDDDLYNCKNSYDYELYDHSKVLKQSNNQQSHTNQQSLPTKPTNFQPNEKLLRRFEDRINVDKYEGPPVLRSTINSILENKRHSDSEKVRIKDKAFRATVEQVLDPRTRIILFKLLNRGVIEQINGCISTGKEANVYHATSKDGIDKAIKIYKTSILVFKDRDKYVNGEFRFRHGYCRHNPRKMVKTWAEKEMRNLTRIHRCGLPCPEPILLRSHVLIMKFIGKDGWPAPLLKDVEITESKARELYLDCIIMMRRLYIDCKLVHADLSDYNLLYHEGKAYIIDVSQSVEHDHPFALEFLRNDCQNISGYFRRKGVPTMTIKELFDFITDPNINNSNIDDYLSKMQEVTCNRTAKEMSEKEKLEEEVFKQAYIPQRLNQVINYERDVSQAKEGEKVLYHTITGLKPDLSGASEQPEILNTSANKEQQTSDDNSIGDKCSDNEKGSKFSNSARPRDESPNSKKERKKAVKDAQREKRKHKMPKHVKKRLEKVGKNKRN